MPDVPFCMAIWVVLQAVFGQKTKFWAIFRQILWGVSPHISPKHRVTPMHLGSYVYAPIFAIFAADMWPGAKFAILGEGKRGAAGRKVNVVPGVFSLYCRAFNACRSAAPFCGMCKISRSGQPKTCTLSRSAWLKICKISRSDISKTCTLSRFQKENAYLCTGQAALGKPGASSLSARLHCLCKGVYAQKRL